MKAWVGCLAVLALVGCGGGGSAADKRTTAQIAGTPAPSATAGSDCTPSEHPYGTAPAGWTYHEANAAERAAFEKSMGGGFPEDLDVALALHGGRPQVFMMAAGGDVAGVSSTIEESARRGGATVRHEDGVTVVDATAGGRTRFKTTGCTFVMVLGAEPGLVDHVAEAVFAAS
jgi:hypothetical protein